MSELEPAKLVHCSLVVVIGGPLQNYSRLQLPASAGSSKEKV